MERNDAEKHITRSAGSLLERLADEEGYLISRTGFEKCVRIGREESGKIIYRPIRVDEHSISFEGCLEEDKLSFEDYRIMWAQMNTFRRLFEDNQEGRMARDLSGYVGREYKEVGLMFADLKKKGKKSRAETEKRASKILREMILKMAGRESIFPDGRCEVVISRESRRNGHYIQPKIWGLVDKGVVFTPIVGTCFGDRIYKVRELIEESMTLRQIKDETTLYDKINTARELCSLLRRFSETGIVHGRIEPSNINIVRKGDGSYDIRTLDFGTRRIYAVESPDFSAPEQASDLGIDQRTDIYTLGATLYTLITGLTPNPIEATGDFETDTQLKVENLRACAEEKQKPVDVVNAVPKGKYDEQDLRNISLVLKKAMQSDPNLRYQNYRDFKSDLDAVAYHEAPKIAAQSEGLQEVFQ